MQMKQSQGLVLEDVVMELAIRALDEERLAMVVSAPRAGAVQPGPLTARRSEQVGVPTAALLELVRMDVAQIAIARRRDAYGLSVIEDSDADAIEMAALDLLLGVGDHARFWAQVALAY
ncbi:unannotated protein [freshwater metagenome]|uniref:Unannotated protein n=1 Tax=freshwater metagenome TaxID=449393 RepID=A0A6J7JPY4_9ZZZZ